MGSLQFSKNLQKDTEHAEVTRHDRNVHMMAHLLWNSPSETQKWTNMWSCHSSPSTHIQLETHQWSAANTSSLLQSGQEQSAQTPGSLASIHPAVSISHHALPPLPHYHSFQPPPPYPRPTTSLQNTIGLTAQGWEPSSSVILSSISASEKLLPLLHPAQLPPLLGSSALLSVKWVPSAHMDTSSGVGGWLAGWPQPMTPTGSVTFSYSERRTTIRSSLFTISCQVWV